MLIFFLQQLLNNKTFIAISSIVGFWYVELLSGGLLVAWLSSRVCHFLVYSNRHTRESSRGDEEEGWRKMLEENTYREKLRFGLAQDMPMAGLKLLAAGHLWNALLVVPCPFLYPDGRELWTESEDLPDRFSRYQNETLNRCLSSTVAHVILQSRNFLNP